MPAVVRVGDHCSAPLPRVATSGSPDVFVNDLPVVRLNDSWSPGTSAEGVPSVLVNDLPICVVGNSISNGSTMIEGSPDVFVGD